MHTGYLFLAVAIIAEVIATSALKASQGFTRLWPSLVVVVGSEGDGLSRLVAENCDLLVSIPMVSSLESLNAGVAAGIALYAVAAARRG